MNCPSIMIGKPHGSNHSAVLQNKAILQRFATRLAEKLKPGDWIALTGDLGAGKTTLVQSICKGLQCVDTVTSPTFSLQNEYVSSVGPIFHIDAYRLPEFERDAFCWELEERAQQEQAIVLVEWAELLPQLQHLWTVQINLASVSGSDEARTVTITVQNPDWTVTLE